MNELFEFESLTETSPKQQAAHRLAIKFIEEKNLPLQFRKGNDKLKKTNENSQLMTRFKSQVNIWDNVVSTMLEKIEPDLAWRIINLNPLIEHETLSVSQNNDFKKFTDYFVQRRDLENCDDEELGCLATLHTEFQRIIERRQPKTKPDFVAIDFEHATREKASICSVGIASFKNGELIDKFYSLVQPPNNEYEWVNSNITKLNSLSTENAPTFVEIYPEIYKRLHNNKVIAHGAFHTDMICLEKAASLHKIEILPNIRWECTQEICDCSLSVATKVCNIELLHHNSLSDAIACGYLYSMHLNGELPLVEFQRVKSEEKNSNKNKLEFYPKQLTGEILKPDFENAKNNTNPFYMKKVVVSGFIDNEKERIANELKELGADVDTSVGVRTNFLIIGDNVGPSKLKKMQENIAAGKDAQIITLFQFDEMKTTNP